MNIDRNAHQLASETKSMQQGDAYCQLKCGVFFTVV